MAASSLAYIPPLTLAVALSYFPPRPHTSPNSVLRLHGDCPRRLRGGSDNRGRILSRENLAALQAPQTPIPEETPAEVKRYSCRGWVYQEMNKTSRYYGTRARPSATMLISCSGRRET